MYNIQMTIDIYDRDNPPDAETLNLIGRARCVINKQAGYSLVNKIGFFSNHVEKAVSCGQHLSVFRDDTSGKIRGYCVWYHNANKETTYIHSLYAFQHRKGAPPVGTPLLDIVKEQAIALGQRAIELEATDYSIGTNFYTNRGFILKGLDDPDATAQTMIWSVPDKACPYS